MTGREANLTNLFAARCPANYRLVGMALQLCVLRIYTMRYEPVNAMLLNEFLKEHRKVQELEKQIKALTATVQKVSEQLELSQRAPQVVANDQ